MTSLFQIMEIAKKYLQQLFLLFTLLQINIMMHGYMQPEAPKQEQGSTEWEYQDFTKKPMKILIYLG